MLPALAADGDTPARRVLVTASLDHQRLVELLWNERQRSLAVAGIAPTTSMPTESTGPDRPVSLGTSAKAARIRAMQARSEHRSRRRLDSVDLLVGILGAELGTVPRAIADVDRVALVARARAYGDVSGTQC